MKREYSQQNVYDALQDRLKFIFEEFDNIYLSFSGGKDSGLLLNLVLDYQQKNYPSKKIYITRTFQRIKDQVEPYWICLPMATRTALSSYEMYWYPWDDKKKESWVREMPDMDYVINLENNPMTTYHYRMHQEDLAKQFGRWYRMSHDMKKTVCLLGIRADESLQRYSGFLNKKKGYKGECWITKHFKDVWCASPLYDWSTIRLLLPKVLLPATTALGTIDPKGRELGILAGANVVMPNLSPANVRKDYLLYDNKICTGSEAAECRADLERRMHAIGYQVVTHRGDSLNKNN